VTTTAATRRRLVADPRLFIGIALVVASVAATAGIVAAADHRVALYTAGSALEPGRRLHASDLVARDVALDSGAELYLGVGRIPHGGLIVTRPIARGELVPTSAVARRAEADATTIVLRLATQVSGAVRAGAAIDVWSAPSPSRATTEDTATGPAPPVVLVADAIVVRVLQDDQGFVSGTKGSAVEVQLPRGRVARVLAAIAGGDALAVVPAGLSLGGGS
jgi:hypothetical protein